VQRIVVSLLFVLLLMYVLALSITSGLSEPFLTFHGSDEIIFHYPVIREFVLQLQVGAIDFSSYSSATTPLFHLLNAMFVIFFDADIRLLRFFNVIISFSAVCLLYRTFRSQCEYDESQSAIYAFLFAVSPYFFGTSFILLTDNLGFLFFIFCLNRLLRYRREGSLSDYIYVIIAFALAVYTRQLYMWLLPTIFYVLMSKEKQGHKKIIAMSAIVVSVIPLCVLFYLWNGLTPPVFKEAHSKGGLYFNFDSIALILANVGFYSLFLYPSAIVKDGLKRFKLIVLVLVIVVIGLLLFPVEYSVGKDGYLWRLSGYFPALFNTSIFLWGFIWLGLYFLVLWWFESKQKSIFFMLLLSFIVVSLFNATSYQKYYDPVILLLLLIFFKANNGMKILDRIGMLVLGVLFLAYSFKEYV